MDEPDIAFDLIVDTAVHVPRPPPPKILR
jgi:hypothetical protein